MDAWWYFEEGRAPQLIKHSASHVKQKLPCMLVYERSVRSSTKQCRCGEARVSLSDFVLLVLEHFPVIVVFE